MLYLSFPHGPNWDPNYLTNSTKLVLSSDPLCGYANRSPKENTFELFQWFRWSLACSQSHNPIMRATALFFFSDITSFVIVLLTIYVFFERNVKHCFKKLSQMLFEFIDRPVLDFHEWTATQYIPLDRPHFVKQKYCGKRQCRKVVIPICYNSLSCNSKKSIIFSICLSVLFSLSQSWSIFTKSSPNWVYILRRNDAENTNLPFSTEWIMALHK
jgi:hypothetical protein